MTSRERRLDLQPLTSGEQAIQDQPKAKECQDERKRTAQHATDVGARAPQTQATGQDERGIAHANTREQPERGGQRSTPATDLGGSSHQR